MALLIRERLLLRTFWSLSSNDVPDVPNGDQHAVAGLPWLIRGRVGTYMVCRLEILSYQGAMTGSRVDVP